MINYITKRPQARTFLEVNAEAGNHDLRGASLDANVAVLPSGRLATRLIASASEGGSFVPNNPNRYQTLSPSVLFKPTERTTVIVEYDYANKLDNNWAFGARASSRTSRIVSAPTCCRRTRARETASRSRTRRRSPSRSSRSLPTRSRPA